MLLVRDYTPADATAFRDLNLAWIRQYFDDTVEEPDRKLLNDPQSYILDRRGHILVAELEGVVVGTVGLVPPAHSDTEDDDATTLELIKMCVQPNIQRQGVGSALMKAAVNRCNECGVKRIWLETNSKLNAAIQLYEKFGFRKLTCGEFSPTPYCRCNCQMVLDL